MKYDAIIRGSEIENALMAFSGYCEVIGGIAQLGERLHGMQEVSGSIPLTSTKVFENGLVQGFDPIV